MPYDLEVIESALECVTSRNVEIGRQYLRIQNALHGVLMCLCEFDNHKEKAPTPEFFDKWRAISTTEFWRVTKLVHDMDAEMKELCKDEAAFDKVFGPEPW